MIDCVSVHNCHLFAGNPLYEQHRLRHRSVVERQGWQLPTVGDMEYDEYDNPAAYYLVWLDADGKARGSSRLYPTDRPYMLEKVFSGLVTKRDLPKSTTIWEGSRFCIDPNLAPDVRKRIAQEIILGYLEFGIARDITNIVGVMLPAYWRSLFIGNGWDVEWLGEVSRSREGFRIVAGSLPVSAAVLASVRAKTGIYDSVLNYGHSLAHVRAA
jgi:acyl homoserine lactone synthase